MGLNDTIYKKKKVKDYIISISISGELAILTVQKEKNILKVKTFVLSRQTNLQKDIIKSILKEFYKIKEIIYNGIEITSDDYDAILLDKMKRVEQNNLIEVKQ